MTAVEELLKQVFHDVLSTFFSTKLEKLFYDICIFASASCTTSTGSSWYYTGGWCNLMLFDMLADISCHDDESRRPAVSSVKHIHQPGCIDVPGTNDIERRTFSPLLTWIQLWISCILLLTLAAPVAVCDTSLCSSEYWCVSTGNADPCSLFSLQNRDVGQLCPCSDYQHNFTICLNNVSAFRHFSFWSVDHEANNRNYEIAWGIWLVPHCH